MILFVIQNLVKRLQLFTDCYYVIDVPIISKNYNKQSNLEHVDHRYMYVHMGQEMLM